jgi:hypothetical protein
MKATVFGLALIMSIGAGMAQEGVTVQSLLDEGYTVAGVMPSNAGPGILLQKETALVMCFVAETPESSDVATQYCKPVH